MPTDPAGDVTLTHISGVELPLDDWLTTFHLAVVVLDPYEYESAWLLDTAGRILDVFSQADVRVGFVVTAAPDDAKAFVGPWADKLFVLCDPEKAFVKSLSLEQLPALVHIGIDGTLLGSAEGWDPDEWRAVVDNLARIMSWKAPDIPAPGDPRPYEGAPAL
ncbi:MAG TPA: hypothetical protein VFU14_04010 [Acidimicrobiales bacterium]|nr:hypothetical protein [Acidimicrobiales bacterium]